MTNDTLSRRHALGLIGAGGAAALAPATRAQRVPAGAAAPGIRWYSSTQTVRWQQQLAPALTPQPADLFAMQVQVALDQPRQPIDGFGGAFTEKGWQALSALPPARRDEALAALFGDQGAAFNLCRTPLGANDISRKWYSYDETDGDFALKDFSVANDRETLIPYIKAAQGHRSGLKLWASPWSPPSWMKTNHFYSCAPAWPGQPATGIRPDQVRAEGTNTFIQDDKYFDAYARYFRRYVEEYAKAGIPIGMVMPQNEFNSAQPFPSCTWTPEGLARFLPFLGREMGKTGTEIFFGTLERPRADFLGKVLADPQAGPLIKGVGVQWAGKGALEDIQREYPQVPIWASEQECGTGTNDWHYARYCWTTMRRYFAAGARAWHYWNMAMPLGGMSGWGWPQNALVSVDTARGTFELTNDYWALRHVSALVEQGARYIPATSFLGFENQMAFRNPNGDLVIVVENETAEPLSIGFAIKGKLFRPTLPGDSFNTIVLPAAMLV